ncbi:MAG: DNA primase [Clostridia bacterium]|nr:DNA primase [Clostridia bacterium]
MAKRIPDSVIEEIKAKSDIVDIVSSYVTLTRKSQQNLFGLCPFHQEKSPSFSVSPHKQIYYCFGCSKGGDVIHFIMDIEHLRYPEAIRFLGERCGVEVPEAEDGDERYQEDKRRRERLYELNTEAARYFYQSLLEAAGQEARAYMKRRGISRQTAVSFGLGFAPERWQGLLDHIRSKGYSEQEIGDSGLFKKNRKDAWYDLFRNRLIFPIIDVMGRIVAFGGRVMDDSVPKYLNSPENLIYTKGQHLYGLNLAKKTRKDRLLIVEGYMDCISLHQAGFDQSVASLGTALTQQQAALLRKYNEEIVLGYDMDNAGRQATLRNIDTLEEKGAKPFVLILPDAKDPDDYIRKHTPDDFNALLREAPTGLDYKFIHAKQSAQHNDRLDKVKYQELATDLLLDIRNPVVQELYIPKVAAELGVPVESVHMLLTQREQEKARNTRPKNPYRPNTSTSSQTTEQPAAVQDSAAKAPEIRGPLLSKVEAAFLIRLTRRPDVYLEHQLRCEAKWFKKSVRPFVEAILAKAAGGELNERSLMSLVNETDDLIRDEISSQLGALLMREENAETQDQIATIMRRQLLLISIHYYSTMSKLISDRLDSGASEEQGDLRKQFIRVRQAMQDTQKELQEMDRAYSFVHEEQDF